MIHDPALLEQLDAFPAERFEGEVFRSTRAGLDPLAPSISGGRWAPLGDVRHQIPVLYTSFEREGALAEISYHWGQLTPRPSKPVFVHRLRVAADRTLRLRRIDLERLGVQMERFAEQHQNLTQEIGAAVDFLECDGLIVPSARWNCENLVLFMGRHALTNRLEAISKERIDWQAWARKAGVVSDD